MKILIVSLALLAASCAPAASDNQAAGNLSDDTMSAAESRANPPPDDSEAPKALPMPESPPLPPATPAKAADAPYTARGQEPGWALTMVDGRIDYQGNYGDVRIQAAAPAPKAIPNGRRYVTERLTVEIVHARCNDSMSGQGYDDTVKVIADGETYQGCGGKRRPDLDM